MVRTQHTGCIVLLMRPYVLVTREPSCATVCAQCVRSGWRGHIGVLQGARTRRRITLCALLRLCSSIFLPGVDSVEIFIHACRDNVLHDKQDGSRCDRYSGSTLEQVSHWPSRVPLRHSHCKALNPWPVSARCACQKSPQNNSSCPA